MNGDKIALGRGLSIIFFEINDKNPAPYNQTVFWINAQYYLQFIKEEKDGIKETLIPGRGKVEEFKKSFNHLKRKLAENHPLKATDVKFLPVPAGFKFPIMYDGDKSSGVDSNSPSPTSLEFISSISTSITPSSSDSISSQSSAEENHAIAYIEPNNSQSQIPMLSRNNSTSSFRDSSKTKNGTSKLISRSNTGTSLFSNNSRAESPKIFKFNIEGRLVILSENHPFLEKIKLERKKTPQSYRKAIRIDNLTDTEIDDLIKSYVNKVIVVGKPNCKA